jgi:twinkle protein
VQYVFLDHLTALAAAEEDERVALERIMADMGSLVKRLDIALILVSHLATPEHGSHEEGARVTIRQFKGSRAIGFWCHFMFGLERDQQSEDDSTRTTTTFRVLKDRYTGRATGATFALGYDRDTGMLFEKSAVSATESGFTSEAEGTPSDF